MAKDNGNLSKGRKDQRRRIKTTNTAIRQSFPQAKTQLDADLLFWQGLAKRG